MVELTLRELEIVRLIEKGLTSKQIAETFGISRRTVGVHRCNILLKLGKQRECEILRLARKKKVI